MKITIELPDEVLQPIIQTSLDTGNSPQYLIEASLVLIRTWNEFCKKDERTICFIRTSDLQRAKQYNNIKLSADID